jgi:hypothetical protein
MTISIMPHKQFVFGIHFGCGWKLRYVNLWGILENAAIES